MRRTLWLIAFLATIGLASAAWGWTKPPFSNVDANHDGIIVFEEIRVFNPKGMTVAVFASIDLNRDGVIDPEEYALMGTRRARLARAYYGPYPGPYPGDYPGAWWKPCASWEGMYYYMVGTNLLLADRDAEAAAMLVQAIGRPLCQDYLGYAYYNLGIACKRLGDEACAQDNLKKARALNTNNAVPPNDFGLYGVPRAGECP